MEKLPKEAIAQFQKVFKECENKEIDFENAQMYAESFMRLLVKALSNKSQK